MDVQHGRNLLKRNAGIVELHGKGAICFRRAAWTSAIGPAGASAINGGPAQVASISKLKRFVGLGGRVSHRKDRPDFLKVVRDGLQFIEGAREMADIRREYNIAVVDSS
jgi:hypothetical protein